MPGLFSAADYANAARALMPRGPIWTDDPETRQSAMLRALAAVLARLDSSAVALRIDVFPASTSRLLPEWEASLGLPDPCGGDYQTWVQRRAQVVARFTAGGGQSRQRYIDFAAAIGFEITITCYTRSAAGRLRAGQRVLGDAWAHAWRVTILNDPVEASLTRFRSGISRAGDPLSTGDWGGAVLVCELDRIKPAHTILLYDA